MTKPKRNLVHQESSPSHLPEATIALADYVAHSRNYNAHSEAQIAKLRTSLRKFGQVKNIVVWRNMFVAGHGLAQAAAAEGWQTLRANVIPDDWPEPRVLAYLAADNELARQSDPDQAALAALIDEVAQYDLELMQAIGYDEAEFAALLAEVTPKAAARDVEPQISKADELQKAWGVQLGDLWQLGAHRLICGDCTDKATVERLMGGEKADITFTSPPYNAAKNSNLPNKDKYQASSDDISESDYLGLLNRFTGIALQFSDYVFVNIQSLSGNKLALIDYLYEQRTNYADTIIWDKQTAEPAMAHNVLNSRFEYIHVFSTKANRAIGTKDFRGTIDNVFCMNSRQDKEFSGVHKATFPLEFPVFFVDNFSERDSLVLEPFNGTGTTLIACEQLSRQCRAIELDAGYCAITLQRFHDATGLQPERIT